MPISALVTSTMPNRASCGWPDDQDHGQQDTEDEIEPGQDVRAQDLGDRAAGALPARVRQARASAARQPARWSGRPAASPRSARPAPEANEAAASAMQDHHVAVKDQRKTRPGPGRVPPRQRPIPARRESPCHRPHRYTLRWPRSLTASSLPQPSPSVLEGSAPTRPALLLNAGSRARGVHHPVAHRHGGTRGRAAEDHQRGITQLKPGLAPRRSDRSRRRPSSYSAVIGEGLRALVQPLAAWGLRAELLECRSAEPRVRVLRCAVLEGKNVRVLDCAIADFDGSPDGLIAVPCAGAC